MIIGIAAAAIVATGLYFGWSRFQRPADQPATLETPVSTPAPIAQPSRLSAPPPAKPSAAPVTTEHAGEPSASKERSRTEGSTEEDSKPGTETSKNSSKSENTADEESPEPAPLVVKGGKAPGKHSKAAAADAPAPSEIGLGTADVVPPPNFTSTEATFKPTLQTLNVSQGVSQGLLIKKVPPSYPPTALRMRIEGKVELVATISSTGEISHVKVLSGDSQLTKAATDAVKKWKYKPYLLNGEPVEIQTQITVVFKLPQ
jgi:TonB family protein